MQGRQLWIELDRSKLAVPLVQQVYDQLRRAILQGKLRAGERLPSTRTLASELRMARSSLVEIYEQLLIEGYVVSTPGSGTYVAHGISCPSEQETIFEEQEPQAVEEQDVIDFRPGVPALAEFPRRIWSRLATQVFAELPASMLGYDQPAGRDELRQVLARYLLRWRGVRCQPAQIIITTGAAQALVLVAQLLLSLTKTLLIEDPAHHEIQQIFTSTGLTLLPIPIDEAGIQTSHLPAPTPGASAFITPSHQFPLGGTLPVQRRQQLLQFVRASGGYIIEDDYDSEMRYSGAVVSSVQGLGPERVIYIGTFSKILAPSLRIGYVILPPPLLETARNLKRFMDMHSPSFDQLILASFISEGHLDRHVLKMRRLYRRRRDALLNSLKTCFPHHLQISGAATGLNLLASFEDITFNADLLAAIEAAGVRVYPVETYAIRKRLHLHELIMGYANLSEARIVEGIHRLQAVLTQA
ncbi:PLP-dependent aminotransferase family protein [Ktedonosporobacter rubrisoli]|uniref:PLP-dependent aminotransferase family protein n=1 Tax=Ktedonosporobacter rubrisoli TaxID=2509675 RepID=A0A4P6JK97_KTERU|nr:PLP-dependent aminotransferase family protein [Ktedonosporobacter rubrisoli]QBD75390.1 PLP-dependent aminotransferase family protein [Ktedonosporobacter rubrisoli]